MDVDLRQLVLAINVKETSEYKVCTSLPLKIDDRVKKLRWNIDSSSLIFGTYYIKAYLVNLHGVFEASASLVTASKFIQS